LGVGDQPLVALLRESERRNLVGHCNSLVGQQVRGLVVVLQGTINSAQRENIEGVGWGPGWGCSVVFR
jgi:hypothetical protein